MALTIRGRAPSTSIDPVISLKDALSGFEELLTDEQKQQYTAVPATKTHASKVLAFITEVDANNQNRGRRCVASRLCSFLEATQQFVGVVETFVSSNPRIAGLVWGGIKMAILTASNITSYFDKVTNLIMSIGKSSPTYTQFGELFPSSIKLQHALCEYYAIIIRLCIRIIEVSQRKAWTQMLTSVVSPFEVEFKPFRDGLDQAVKEIKQQIWLSSRQADHETAMLIKQDSQENQKYRRFLSKFGSESRQEYEQAREWRVRRSAREMQRLRLRIKNNLSTIDHLKAWNHLHKQRAPHTAEWLGQDPTFVEWKEDLETAILWCPGTLGVGKTVLTSHLIALLNQSSTERDVICHFFCRTENQVSLSARSVLGSFALQVMELGINGANNDRLYDQEKLTGNLDSADVIDLLVSQLSDDKLYYFILDGLDEAEKDSIRDIAEGFAKLCASRSQNLKILYTGRPELEHDLFKKRKFDHKLPLAKSRVAQDIAQYSRATLDQYIEDGRLTLRNLTLKAQILQVLGEESDGM